MTLLDQPWIGPKQILEIGCEEPQVEAESRSMKTGSKPALGGLKALAADDEEVQNMALFALDSLDNFDDNSQKRVLVRVLEAGYQVRSNFLFHEAQHGHFHRFSPVIRLWLVSCTK